MTSTMYLPLPCGDNCCWKADGEHATHALEFLRSITNLTTCSFGTTTWNCRIHDAESIIPEEQFFPCGYAQKVYVNTSNGHSLIQIQDYDPISNLRRGSQARSLFFLGILEMLCRGKLFLLHGSLAKEQGIVFCGLPENDRTTTQVHFPSKRDIAGDDSVLLSQHDDDWYAQTVPNWSIWLYGKPLRSFDCKEKVKIKKIYVSAHDAKIMTALEKQDALPQLLPSFIDSILWNVPKRWNAIRQRLMKNAFVGAAQLISGLQVEQANPEK